MQLQTRTVVDALIAAEHRIALLQRCRAHNHDQELLRLCGAARRGGSLVPAFTYAAAPDLKRTREQLDGLSRLGAFGPFGELLAERAVELQLEAAMAEAVGSAALPTLSRRRYLETHRERASAALSCALRWADEGPGAAASEPLFDSDDIEQPLSLYCQTQALLEELGVPFRVRVSRTLLAVAATGDGVIFVATGHKLCAAEARRIALHEVRGHALPRARAARHPTRLFLAGTAGGTDDEEGHALLIEQEAGLLSQARRHHLALRHIAAVGLFEGGTFADVVQRLSPSYCDVQEALRITARVFRGGGLGRELVYLPAWLRVRECFEHSPRARELLGRGRIGVRHVARLLTLGEPPALLRAEPIQLSSAMTGQ